LQIREVPCAFAAGRPCAWMDVLSKQATSVPAKDPDLPETVTSGVGHHVKKDAFVVRNTFIDQIPGTPNSPFGERQVHSCPPTSLLDHATPQQEDARKLGIGATVLAAVPSSPGSDCDSNKSGLHGSRDQKPWSPDVVQKLVDEAAAVLEMHTPSLPGASRRSSPLMAKASPLMKSADLVSSAVADAASAADASPEGKPPEICGTPSPWQNHSHSRQEFMCATPSPWQGSAVVNPEITAKLLAMGQQKGSDGSVQDPVAMIVASAAAAANKDPPVPPPAQAPPAQYSKAAMSPQVAPPLRLPRIESGIGVIEEGDNTFPHSASSDPEIAPDLQAMAASFASLVKPEQPGAEAVQWWQPMKETLSVEEEAGILDFIQRWGLDENCDRVLRNLPSHVRQEVLASFLASADTRNVSAKFMSWLSSRMRNFEEIECALVTTPEERKAFYEKWRLDQKCRQLVEEQAPSVQRELISNFNPPPGTKNVAGRMTAFLNMILNKTRFRGSGGANSPSKHQASKGGRNVAQESFGDQEHADKVSEFVSRWGLDNGARSALLTLPPEAQQAAMDGFSPSMSTECTSRRFIAYLRSAKPHLNRKGKSGGKGRQPKVYSEPPLEPGLMLQPQRVAVVATGPMTMMPN